MVTFRFYLVSIVAFFLALAVGVVVGSVLDEGISNSLQDRLERVEGNLDDTVASIDDKNREIDDLQRYAEESAPFAVENRLTGTSTLVVAEPGLDTGPVEDLVQRLRQGGSHVEGIVWLDPRWDLTDDEDKGRFAEIADAADLSVQQLHRGAWSDLLTTASAGPTDPDPTTTTTDAPPEGGSDGTTTTTVVPGPPLDLFSNELLTQLEEGGFLRLVRLDGDDAEGGSSLTVVAVTGRESEFAVPGSAAIALSEQSTGLELPTVLAEIWVDGDDSEDPPERGIIVRGAASRSGAGFSTVDDLELVAGRVATALALGDQREGVVGHYGYGPDVDGVLPRWPGP